MTGYQRQLANAIIQAQMRTMPELDAVAARVAAQAALPEVAAIANIPPGPIPFSGLRPIQSN